MYLYIYFTDKHVERHHIKFFLDRSKTPLQYYYYEEQNDKPNEGTIIKCQNIECFYLSFEPRYALESKIEQKGDNA